MKLEQGPFSWVYRLIDSKAATSNEKSSMGQDRTPDNDKVPATIPQAEAKFAWLNRWMNRTTSTSSDESLAGGSPTTDGDEAHLATPQNEAESAALVPQPKSQGEPVELSGSSDEAIIEEKKAAMDELMENLETEVPVRRRKKLMENDPEWDAKWKLEEEAMKKRALLARKMKKDEDRRLMYGQQREATARGGLLGTKRSPK